MKKIISFFLLTIFISIMSTETANAAITSTEQQTNFATQVKEKKLIIKQKTKAASKLEFQINRKSQQISDLYDSIFKENMVPNDKIIADIEAREDEITKIVQQILQIDRDMVRYGKQITLNLKQKNYNEVLLNYNRIASLLDKKIDLLKVHTASLQSYLEFLQLLKLK